jgi:hypothetical protein
MNIIFLDIDGPMIPYRAMYMKGQTLDPPAMFDPCAVGLLNRLADKTQSKIVVHSHWRKSTEHKEKYPDIRQHLINQGIKEEHLDIDDHLCPGDRTTDRWEDIHTYLYKNDKVEKFVIIEDLDCPEKWSSLKPHHCFINYDEGFGWKEYICATEIMKVKEQTLMFG